MSTSRTPAVIDALVTLCAAAPTLVGVTVVDGPFTTNLADPDVLFVGDTARGDPAANAQQTWAGLGAQRRDQIVEVVLTAVSRAGETVMKPRRDRAYEIVAAVEDAMRADPTLGGVVIAAGAGTAESLDQAQTPQGAYAAVTFRVQAKARI